MTELIGVVIGGLLALGGGVWSHWYQHRLSSAEERRKLKAAKIEELLAAVYEFDHWLDEKRNKEVFGEDRPDTVCPFAKLEAIAAVHFPRFLPRMRELRLEGRKYERWMISRKTKRLEKAIGELNDGFDDVYGNYLAKRDELQTEVVSYAKEQFTTD